MCHFHEFHYANRLYEKSMNAFLEALDRAGSSASWSQVESAIGLVCVRNTLAPLPRLPANEKRKLTALVWQKIASMDANENVKKSRIDGTPVVPIECDDWILDDNDNGSSDNTLTNVIIDNAKNRLADKIRSDLGWERAYDKVNFDNVREVVESHSANAAVAIHCWYSVAMAAVRVGDTALLWAIDESHGAALRNAMGSNYLHTLIGLDDTAFHKQLFDICPQSSCGACAVLQERESKHTQNC